jgi:pimeloyl-ACP methyl ester carboxylesterase
VTTIEAGTARRLRRAVDDPLDDLRSSFLRLAERFDADAAGRLHATYLVAIPGRAPTTVEVRDGRCFLSPGTAPAPSVRFDTDAATWLDLVEGRTDGIAAFLAGRLAIEGDLNLAARFETLFRPAPGATRVLRTRTTDVRGVKLESIVAGTGTPVLLLHGLGASKVSFLPTLDGLANDRYEVHALDLPGFGRSSKPLPAGRRYSMAWMADIVHGYLIRNRLRDVHLVGNSMGGRIATELALRHPGSVRSVVGLGSAVAFDEYKRLGPLLRLTRPQYLAALPVALRRSWVEAGIRDLFHDPSRVPEANHRAAAADVLRDMRDPAYRMAFASCARSLGMERAVGRGSYWTRLAACGVPSYWIFGRHDRLVRHTYAERVRAALPAAKVELWDDCGHVPQFEHPDRVNERLTTWLGRLDGTR